MKVKVLVTICNDIKRRKKRKKKTQRLSYTNPKSVKNFVKKNGTFAINNRYYTKYKTTFKVNLTLEFLEMIVLAAKRRAAKKRYNNNIAVEKKHTR